MSTPTAANAAPVRYEAETAAITQGVVESNHAGFSGTGFVNFDNVAGSAVEFTVNAPQSGSATLTFRYANGTADNRPVDVSVNGSLAVDERAFPGTGAWTTWQTVTNTVTLNEGQNKIRVTSSGASGGPNLDALDVEQTPQAPALEQEAETATINQGVVESNHAGFSGTGFVNYNNVTGSYVEYTIDAAQAGEHNLAFRYANGTAVDRPLAVSVDGGAATNVSFPGTGAWTTWQTATTKVVLKAGVNKIRGTATTANGGPNADKLTATFAGPVDDEDPTPPKNLQFVSSTHNSVTLKWEAASDNVGVVGYDIYQHGQLVTSVGNVLTGTATGLRPNTEYDWTVFAKDAAGNVSQASNNVPGKTQPAPPDNEPPSVPQNLRVTGTTATSVSLAWNASSDNEAVTGYDVFVDGAPGTTADGTTSTVAGLTTGKAYVFKVRAKDAAGNLSEFSNQVTATPSAGGPKGVPNPGTVRQIVGGTDVPWGVAFLPDGSALITERETFKIYKLTEAGNRVDVGTVPGAQSTGGEGGAMGIEISPNFASDQYIYVYHTYSGGNRLVRAQFNGANITGWTTLLDGVPKNRFHNGGRLRFSPDGRYLYISTGDAQNGNNAQNMNTNAGKILRIFPDGSIPPDNPFSGKAIWSYGHRNVQGLDFDSQGRLWASEFGNSSQDEVNLITKGGNYGWPACEGTSGSCGGTIPPKKTWSVSAASPSGLTIINDHVFVATTRGARVYRMRIDASANLVEQQIYFQGTYGRLRTVEVDKEGDIWLTTSADKDGSTNNDRVLHVDIVYEGGEPPTDFKLTSTAFADNAMIPAKYTCAGDGSPGQDPSPPFAWGASTGAKAYAIVFADRVNNGNKLHWAIWDVPASTLSLPENLGAGFNVPNQGGAKQKAMGSGANSQKFFGPCPGGSTNPYTFTLYALNTATVPGITSGSTMAQIETAIKNASTANTVLRGRSNASS